jgi:KDO2-lipid IV(A) lauroyltransferase
LSLSYRLQFLGFRLVFGLFAALPMAAALRLGSWVGDLLYLVDWPHRRLALQNLERAFPDKSPRQRKRILRASCRNLGRLAVEFSHLPDLDRESVA